MASLSENIARTVSSLDAIEQSIADHGVDMSEQIAVEEYPSKIGEVYSAGYASGNEEGYSKGYSAGTQNGLPTTWDYFWDSFQIRGTRTDYNAAFRGDGKRGWTADNFIPKYDIIPKGVCMFMFANSKIEGDLTEILLECGINLKTNNCTNLTQAFSSTLFTRIGEVDLTGVTSSTGCYGLFASWGTSRLETIDKLIINRTNVFTDVFKGCDRLRNLTIEGTIAQKDFNLQWSTLLSRASILGKEATEEQIQAGTNLVLLNDKYYYGGIFGALSDSTSGLTVTLSKTAINNAFGIDVDDETTWGEGTDYYNLRHSKDNWTISYM